MDAALEPYLRNLREIDFVTGADVRDSGKIQDPNIDALAVVAKRKKYPFRLQLSRSHLSRAYVDFICNLATEGKGNYFVFAPAIGGESAKLFDEANVNYMDRAGNCRVRLGDAFFVRTEGRRSKVSPRARELRASSLRVVFALLARRSALNMTVREIASIAGNVSPQTVSDVKKRLVAENWVLEAKRGLEWTPGGVARALDTLALGAERFLRHLELGRFQSRLPPRELERELAKRFEERVFRFGGGVAASRINGFYRGLQTVVYLEPPLPNGTGLLVPAGRDDVIFRRFPGVAAVEENGEVAPLLVYLDLVAEAEPRAHEAAEELRRGILDGVVS